MDWCDHIDMKPPLGNSVLEGLEQLPFLMMSLTVPLSHHMISYDWWGF